MRICFRGALILSVIGFIFVISLVFHLFFGNDARHVARLLFHRVLLPAAERQICSAKSRMGYEFSHRQIGMEETCSLPSAPSEEDPAGFWREHIQATASEIVAKAHAELHFTKRIVLLGSTLETEKLLLKKDFLAKGDDVTLDCAAAPTDLMRAFLIQGYSLANVLVVETSQSLLLVDTGDHAFGLRYMLQSLSNHTCPANAAKPVRYVLISHHHVDHVGGIGGAAEYNQLLNNPIDPIVISHTTTVAAMTDYFLMHPQANLRRAMKQFGISRHVERARSRYSPPLKEDESRATNRKPTVISAGIGLALEAVDLDSTTLSHAESLIQYPTHTWNGTNKTFVFDNNRVDMILSPGETSDQITFYFPAAKLFFISDNFYFAFPNIYPLRGGVFRSPANWWKTLDNFLHVYAPVTEVLAPGHTSPVFGTQLIVLLVERYRDSLQFIHDQTIRSMNRLQDADAVARHVADLFWSTFPKISAAMYPKSALQTIPALLMDPVMPYYGQLHWASKAVVYRERGWFSGRVEEVNSHRLLSGARSSRLSRLINNSSSDILAASIEALSTYDCQWALELTTLATAGMSQEESLHELQAPGLSLLGETCSSSWNISDYDASLSDVLAEWVNSTCGRKRRRAERPALEQTEEKLCGPMTSLPSTLRCARRQALWCLARRELPSSGRNWYLLEALDDRERADDEAALAKTATLLRSSFLARTPDLLKVVASFPWRLEPGVVSFHHVPTVFRLHLIQRRVGASDAPVEEDRDFTPVTLPSNTTVELILRNAILVVVTEQLAVRDHSDPNYIEIYMTWTAFRQILTKAYPTGPLRLYLEGNLWFENSRSSTQNIRDLCKFMELLLALEYE